MARGTVRCVIEADRCAPVSGLDGYPGYGHTGSQHRSPSRLGHPEAAVWIESVVTGAVLAGC